MAAKVRYRSIVAGLLDRQSFQQLSERARWVFIALKVSFGPSGIEVRYAQALVAELAAQTGARPEDVEHALNELEQANWIEREANVTWVKGQLEDDPHMSWRDEKHRVSVGRHVAGLPDLPIVSRYKDAHPDWLEDQGLSTTKASGSNQAMTPDAPGSDSTRTLIQGPREGLGRSSEGPSRAFRPPRRKTRRTTIRSTRR